MSTITREMLIGDIILAYPQTRLVFEMHGMGCILCMGAMDETIEGGARMHGISIDDLIGDLNRAAGAEIAER